MKTTVELSDELFRRAKSEAALRGRKFKDLVEEGLRRVLESPDSLDSRTAKPEPPTAYELMKDGCGIVDSGMGDLASNQKHLAGFGE